jgi:hypothetical protein
MNILKYIVEQHMCTIGTSYVSYKKYRKIKEWNYVTGKENNKKDKTKETSWLWKKIKIQKKN